MNQYDEFSGSAQFRTVELNTLTADYEAVFVEQPSGAVDTVHAAT